MDKWDRLYDHALQSTREIQDALELDVPYETMRVHVDLALQNAIAAWAALDSVKLCEVP